MVAERVSWESVRKVGARLTTPLHPDDYLSLINPLWTARELRGRIEKVVPETEDAATIVIRPGWGWRHDHHPGQYIGIGVQVKGKFHWRSYSVSSPPKRSGRTIAITVRAMPEGCLSEHLVSGLAPGAAYRNGRVDLEGERMTLDLSRKRVTHCALSRICGACGESLGRPISIVGTRAEEAANAFHAPPLHQHCAGVVLDAEARFTELVNTAGFEFVRPNRDDLDQQVRLVPNSRVEC